MPSTKEKIRQFIVDNLLFGEGGDKLLDDDSLLDQGIIDSTGVLELVIFLEGAYGIQIKETELIPANLDSVNQMVQFIERKTGVFAGEGTPSAS